MRVLIVNYGKNLPRVDQDILCLRVGIEDDINSKATDIWATAVYMSQHPFQAPDIVHDPAELYTFEDSFDTVISMRPSDPFLYVTPQFWDNVRSWLKPGGIFVAVPQDDHIIDAYLTKANKYDVHMKHQSYPYSLMTPAEKSVIEVCYQNLRLDISRLTNSQLIPCIDARSAVSAGLTYRALYFTKENVTSVNTV